MIWKYVVDLTLSEDDLGNIITGFRVRFNRTIIVLYPLEPVGVFHPDFLNLAVF